MDQGHNGSGRRRTNHIFSYIHQGSCFCNGFNSLWNVHIHFISIIVSIKRSRARQGKTKGQSWNWINLKGHHVHAMQCWLAIEPHPIPFLQVFFHNPAHSQGCSQSTALVVRHEYQGNYAWSLAILRLNYSVCSSLRMSSSHYFGLETVNIYVRNSHRLRQDFHSALRHSQCPYVFHHVDTHHCPRTKVCAISSQRRTKSSCLSTQTLLKSI